MGQSGGAFQVSRIFRRRWKCRGERGWVRCDRSGLRNVVGIKLARDVDIAVGVIS